MITEIAEILVKPGSKQQFEAGVTQAVPLFQRARGCRSMKLERGIENADAYRLVVEWDTLEDHEVHFRGSEDFQAWRALVGGFFAEPPRVSHTCNVLDGF
ncbi:antibiotic biosynthesis monooxygenase family protein [Massilia glaciei]|uniref:Antibiotic biosynthesis monooxygenase n=1 Tax=Massilia glaciei TaxID=1524097 RepID=A0A2U2HP83_9BURK|nr:antibiotic biosynthesis monooxygenase family protein [Massilia glaciei]PWF49334.1 antibiotic biosynthesis monooxygenase [Massilia glaciei]